MEGKFCSYCKTPLNNGASVCTGCGAFRSTPIRQGGLATVLFLLFLWSNYLFFGPGLIVVPFVEKGAPIGVAAVGLAVTIIGFVLLRKITKWFARPLWYRRN